MKCRSGCSFQSAASCHVPNFTGRLPPPLFQQIQRVFEYKCDGLSVPRLQLSACPLLLIGRCHCPPAWLTWSAMRPPWLLPLLCLGTVLLPAALGRPMAGRELQASGRLPWPRRRQARCTKLQRRPSYAQPCPTNTAVTLATHCDWLCLPLQAQSSSTNQCRPLIAHPEGTLLGECTERAGRLCLVHPAAKPY